MSLPYEKLTQILGDLATEHTPESETTPEFMNGKFDELLVNDKYLYNQINDCLTKVVSKVHINTGIDLNTLTAFNKEWITKNNAVARTCLNIPHNNVLSFSIKNIECVWGANTYLLQVLEAYAERWFRTRDNNAWGEWQKIATTTKTNISLANGWGVYVGEAIAVKNGNLVTISPIRLSGGTTAQGTILFTLPSGYRPKTTRHATAFWDITKPTLLTIGTNGNVSILYSDAPTTSSGLVLNISFTIE